MMDWFQGRKISLMSGLYQIKRLINSAPEYNIPRTLQTPEWGDYRVSTLVNFENLNKVARRGCFLTYGLWQWLASFIQPLSLLLFTSYLLPFSSLFEGAYAAIQSEKKLQMGKRLMRLKLFFSFFFLFGVVESLRRESKFRFLKIVKIYKIGSNGKNE